LLVKRFQLFFLRPTAYPAVLDGWAAGTSTRISGHDHCPVPARSCRWLLEEAATERTGQRPPKAVW